MKNVNNAMITMGMPMNTVNASGKLRMRHIIRAGGSAVLSGLLSWVPVLQASGEDVARGIRDASLHLTLRGRMSDFECRREGLFGRGCLGASPCQKR